MSVAGSGKMDHYPFGMEIPGKTFSSGYRYGFNGKEKDNELKGAGNSVDYGARFYDPRLGKWWSVDPMRQIYGAVSPYHFGGNNPVNILDADGNILKDKNGNIIATANARVDGEHNKKTYSYKFKDGSSASLQVSYKYVTIYTDEGNPVTAQMVTKVIYTETGKNGKTVQKPVPKALDASANCHGYAFAEGKVIITDDASLKAIIKDEYKYISQNPGDSKNADVLVILDAANTTSEDDLKRGEIDVDDWHHTAKKEKLNGKPKRTYTDKDTERARRFNLTPAEVETYDDDEGDQKILYYKKEKNKDGRRVSTTSGTVSNGVRTVSAEEAARILQTLKPATTN